MDVFSFPLEEEYGADEIYLRVSLDTSEIVGFDIMDFSQVFIPNHKDAFDAFGPWFDLFGTMDWRIQLRLPTEEAEAAQIALLLPARASLEYFPRYIPRYIPKVAPGLVPA